MRMIKRHDLCRLLMQFGYFQLLIHAINTLWQAGRWKQKIFRQPENYFSFHGIATKAKFHVFYASYETKGILPFSKENAIQNNTNQCGMVARRASKVHLTPPYMGVYIRVVTCTKKMILCNGGLNCGSPSKASRKMYYWTVNSWYNTTMILIVVALFVTWPKTTFA